MFNKVKLSNIFLKRNTYVLNILFKIIVEV